MASTRLLWLSRHSPTAEQLKELRDALGSVTVVLQPATVNSASDVVELMRIHSCDEVMAVLPLSHLLELSKLGVKPIIAVTANRGVHSHFARLNWLEAFLEKLGGR